MHIYIYECVCVIKQLIFNSVQCRCGWGGGDPCTAITECNADVGGGGYQCTETVSSVGMGVDGCPH